MERADSKVFRALGFRIIDSRKSKYYQHVLRHFKKARDLYKKSGREDLWRFIVDLVRRKHSRKVGFIGDFEALAARKTPARTTSFEEKMRNRWARQVR